MNNIKNIAEGTMYDIERLPYMSDEEFAEYKKLARVDGYPWDAGTYVKTFQSTDRATAQWQYQDFLNAMRFRKNFKLMDVQHIEGYRHDSIMVTYSIDGAFDDPD